MYHYTHTFDCYVHNYSLVEEQKYELYTDTHSAANQQWRLHIYPKGKLANEELESVSVYLQPTDLGDSLVHVDCEVSLVSSSDWSKNITRTFIKKFQTGVSTWGWSNFATLAQLKDPASGFLQGNRIHFRVQILPRDDEAAGQEGSLFQKYYRLADGVVKVDGEQFPVHATRLAESSHVIANMLLDLSEDFSISQKVDLSVLFRGFSCEVVFQLLCHVYNPQHKMGTLYHVQELAELAKKLFMPSLERKIRKFIVQNYSLIQLKPGKDEQQETHVLQIMCMAERLRWCDVMLVCEWVIFQQGRLLAGSDQISKKIQARILKIQGNTKLTNNKLREVTLSQYIAACQQIYCDGIF